MADDDDAVVEGDVVLAVTVAVVSADSNSDGADADADGIAPVLRCDDGELDSSGMDRVWCSVELVDAVGAAVLTDGVDIVGSDYM